MDGWDACLFEGLEDALDRFSKDTGLQVIYRAKIASGVQSGETRAGASAEEALRDILRGTGLEFEFINPRTVAIVAPGERMKLTAADDAAATRPGRSRGRR